MREARNFPSILPRLSHPKGLVFMSKYEKILDSALKLPLGLALVCQDPTSADKVKRQLYAERARLREQGDSSFDVLSISISPFSDDTLFLYVKDSSNE
jgi:hypothetical protein